MSAGISDLLARVDGDRDLLSGLIEIFLTDAPGMLVDLRCSVERGDAAAVRQQAHLLRGSAGLFGAAGTLAAAMAIETLAKDGDLAAASPHLRMLEQEIVYLTGHLRRVIAKLAA